jgi:hypothetical protein
MTPLTFFFVVGLVFVRERTGLCGIALARLHASAPCARTFVRVLWKAELRH